MLRYPISSLLLLCLLFNIVSTDSYAQLEQLEQRLVEYKQILSDQRIYIHTDKILYNTDEHIWFKVYMTDEQLQTSDKSHGIYVDLYNPKGDQIERIFLNYNQFVGAAIGDFYIPESYAGGLYKIKAYTNWGQNLDKEHIFEKEIVVQKVIYPNLLLTLDYEMASYSAGDEVFANLSIRKLNDEPYANEKLEFEVLLDNGQNIKDSVQTDGEGNALIYFKLPDTILNNRAILNVSTLYKNTRESIARPVPLVIQAAVDIQLLPEGGNLVAGIQQKIAFKAVDTLGFPVEIKAELRDAQNQVLSDFESYHDGMGSFVFTPKSNQKYTVHITHPQHAQQQIVLPDASGKIGLNLIDHNAKELKLKIYTEEAQKLYAVAQIQGKLHYKKEINTNKGQTDWIIPLDSLPMGIAKLTILDTQLRPQAERLVFVNQDRQLDIKITSDRKKYLPNDEVSLQIEVKDETGRPVVGHFSMAVVDDRNIQYIDDKQANILSQLLLNSDLKGQVHEPNFYFDPEETKADTALDHVMLTHGWRRYNWEKLLEPKAPKLWKTKRFASADAWCIQGSIHKALERIYQYSNDDYNDYSVDYIELPLVKKRVYLVPRKPFMRKKEIKQNALASTMTDAYGQFSFILHDYSFSDPYQEWSIHTWHKLKSFSQETDHIRKLVYQIDFDAWKARLAAEEQRLSMEEPQKLMIREEDAERNDRYSSNDIYVDCLRVLGGSFASGSASTQALSSSGWGMRKSPITTYSLSISSVTQQFQTYFFGRVINSRLVMALTSGEGKIRNSSNYNPYSLYSTEVAENYGTTLVEYKQARNNVISYYKPKKHGYDRWGLTLSQDTDPKTTLFWNPDILTDSLGQAEISFFIPNISTTYRATLEGRALQGKLGRAEQTIYVQQPYELQTKLPSVVSVGDTIEVRVIVTNNTRSSKSLDIRIDAPYNFRLLKDLKPEPPVVIEYLYAEDGSPLPVPEPEPEPKVVLYVDRNGALYTYDHNRSVRVDAEKYTVATFYYEVSRYQKSSKFRVAVADYSKSITQKDEYIKTRKNAFPQQFSYSSDKNDAQFEVTLPKNSREVHAQFKIFPNVWQQLEDGLSSIIRQPYGCFEQVSSSNYPNIMALQTMKMLDTLNPSVRQRSIKFLAKGYDKIKGYETPKGGFEWYGRAPGHEGLTAYGLIQLVDMREVYPVEQELIDRIQKWLLNKRTGYGGFEQIKGKYGFSSSAEEVTNAYILYALSAAKVPVTEISKELATAEKVARERKDLYQLALLSIAYSNLNIKDKAEGLLLVIQEELSTTALENIEVSSTLVRSFGRNQQQETAALMLSAFLASANQADYQAQIQELISFVLSGRNGHGGFGSTQATILSLKALVAYLNQNTKKKTDGTWIYLHVNDQIVDSLAYNRKGVSPRQSIYLATHLKKGQKNQVKVTFQDTSQRLSYMLSSNWNELDLPKPKTHPLAQLDFQLKRIGAHAKSDSAQVGDLVSIEAQLSNQGKETIGSPTLVLELPAGLSPVISQLKQLSDQRQIDYYEIIDHKLIVYYTHLRAGASKTLRLDLKAELAGNYPPQICVAYPYYNDEYKIWQKTPKLNIKP
ncbi:MAG: hypothetical protein MK212_03485 [Saprospiraceae bacterium]|nr:hypothetical protein [Saprospiraceae bacterium]